MNHVEFRKVFGHGREADEGIYAFSNYIQSHEDAFRIIVSKFKSVARQITFVLNNLEIEDQKQFEKLRWLEQSLLDLDDLRANYDDEKILTRAIWSIFAAWSAIDGDLGYDPIERAIDEI